MEWLRAFKSPESNYPLLPLSSIVRSTSDARTDRCAASRSNNSRFLGSVAKSRITLALGSLSAEFFQLGQHVLHRATRYCLFCPIIKRNGA